MVLRAGIEPARPQGTQDFKSCASTYSATQALSKRLTRVFKEFKAEISGRKTSAE